VLVLFPCVERSFFLFVGEFAILHNVGGRLKVRFRFLNLVGLYLRFRVIRISS
jgi:hypothetical protein